MGDNLPAAVAFSFVNSAPVLVWSATRSRPDSWRGAAGLFVEVLAVIIMAAFLTRYVAVQARQWAEHG